MPKGKSAITANTCPSSPFRSSARSGQNRDDLLGVGGGDEEDEQRHEQSINRDGFGEDDRENHVRTYEACREVVAAYLSERGTVEHADCYSVSHGCRDK